MSAESVSFTNTGIRILSRTALAGLLAAIITGSCGGGEPAGGSVSGRVVMQDGAGLAGVVITATSSVFNSDGGGCGTVSYATSTTTTDGDGYYIFYTGDHSGRSTLTPSRTGYVFTPGSREVSGSSSSAVMGQDFVASQATGTAVSGNALEVN